jgi:YD repeat-containing protein
LIILFCHLQLLTTIFPTLILLIGGDFAVAKNQASSASFGDLCALAVKHSFPDSIGRRTTATAKNKLGTLLSNETYSYDLRSQLTGYAGTTGSIGYGYDSAGNLAGTKSATPGGYDVSYDYDTLNRITKVHRGQEGIDPTATQFAAYNYDANGNLNGTGYANGVQHAYT